MEGDTEDSKSEGLSAIQVHTAILEDRLRDACQQGDLGVVKMILSDCPKSEIQEILRRSSNCTGTPLFDAIISQQAHVVSYLIDLGSDLEQECSVNIFYPIFFRDKCSALCLACACGEVDIAKLLLERGANVNHSSLHSSPLIYASEYNNVDLMTLLLDHGADVHMVPRSLQSEGALLPLYQACLNGHCDTAQLLLNRSTANLSMDKKMCLLGLLGAQCINKNQDFEAGLRFWREALGELEKCQKSGDAKEELAVSSLDGQGKGLGGPSGAEGDSSQGNLHNLSRLLHEMYIQGSREVTPFVNMSDSPEKSGKIFPHKLSVFKGMRLCTSVAELDALASDHTALILQGLLVLESILGPSHPETTQQVSHAARIALENGDLGQACKLFLYIIEGNENRDQTSTATEYTSQMADLLLNVFCNFPENLQRIDDLVDMLLAALELVAQGMHKVFSNFVVGQSKKEAAIGYFETQVKHHSTIRLMTEMVETFMALLRMMVDQTIQEKHWKKLHVLTSDLLKLSHKIQNPKFNFESDVLKIAVYGGQSALSTLYFFQEDLYPSVKILEFLLVCGARVNCQDLRGDTPLHYSLDCPKPESRIVEILLDNGGHIDICNRSGVTPYSLLMKSPCKGIQPFHHITLKCLAARAIMNFGVKYQGQIPRMLEDFIPLHGLTRLQRPAKLRKASSVEELRLSGSDVNQ